MTFKVTLKDVYDIVKENDKTTQRIENHCITTNGKVKLNKWIGTTALSLVIVAIGLMVNHIATAGGL
mgnify:CR=1 FL=1